MKRFLTMVLMLCLCVGLCAGCAQNQQPDPQKPENGTLTAEELEEFQAMFTPGSWYSQATTSSYTSPKDIDLHHLFYDGIGFYGLLYGHTYLTDRERAYLTSLDPESVMQYFRAPRQVMDAVLKEYFGVSLAETNQVGLSKFVYWAETDSYYIDHTDTRMTSVTLTGGERAEDGTVTLRRDRPDPPRRPRHRRVYSPFPPVRMTERYETTHPPEYCSGGCSFPGNKWL